MKLTAAIWDAPASDYAPNLPATLTLREYARQRRADGLTCRQVGEELALPVNSLSATVSVATQCPEMANLSKRGAKKRAKKRGSLTAKQKRRLRKHYRDVAEGRVSLACMRGQREVAA